MFEVLSKPLNMGPVGQERVLTMGGQGSIIPNQRTDNPLTHAFSSRSHCRTVDFDLEQIRRTERIERPRQSTDIFPSTWFLFYGCSGSAKTTLNLGPQSVEVGPGLGVFIPPFQAVHWGHTAGDLQWEAWRSLSPLPPHLDSSVLVFPFDSSNSFTASQSVIETINTQIRNGFARRLNVQASSLLKTLKLKIDSLYLETITLEIICQEVGISLSNASHQFRSTFGISMVRYRQILRLNHSIMTLAWNDESVTAACFGSGFDDLSRFYRSFHKHYQCRPSHFQQRRLSL